MRVSGERFARELRDAGVDVHCEFEPGAAHGHLNEAFDAEATRSIERIVEWVTSRR